jgi:hypothetical protein
MALTIHANWVQKSGNSEAEYEDALAFRSGSQRIAPRHQSRSRVAIADGATDSWCSGLWASLVVEAAIQGKRNTNQSIIDRFEQLRERWRRHAIPPNLSWVSEEKARGGGHAAVLSVSVSPQIASGSPGTWSAWSIGDCCLFHLRSGQLVTSFPYTRPEEFTSSPVLLGTAIPKDVVASLVSEREGTWLPGDEFLLATDAMALWCLERVDEKGQYDKTEIANATRPPSRDEFAAWVASARESGQLRNDDTTLVYLRTE